MHVRSKFPHGASQEPLLTLDLSNRLQLEKK